MHIKAETLDDLLRVVITKLLKSKKWIKPTKGEMTEITGAILELSNPRARLSQTESKGTVFSCLGELSWYLAKSNDLKFIQYYIKNYDKYSDDKKTLYGAYGPRLFGTKGNPHDQIANVISLLKRKRSSRQAVVQVFSAADLTVTTEDVPCTCTLQFILRQRRLQLIAHMRSNDAYLGMPHDIFAFTMLQEIVARSLRVGLGKYSHTVGSLHLYKKHRVKAQTYLKSGWQQKTNAAMPEMPPGNPWPAIRAFLKAERRIRNGKLVDIKQLNLSPYWADLVRLLQVFAHFKNERGEDIAGVKKKMRARVYDSYIEDKRQNIGK